MDCIWVNLKNVGTPFFKCLSVYIKTAFTQRENHSQLLCGLDFANERLLRDLAPLISQRVQIVMLVASRLTPWSSGQKAALKTRDSEFKFPSLPLDEFVFGSPETSSSLSC